ncbi:MAG: hypothetical protein M3Z64_02900 [Verrucomicrobiota bacterium]|nr:hypothetical protein [Verrucomicrobiota bacterium]
MRDADRKPESLPPEAAELTKLLDIELIHKRAEWQRASARNRSLRAMAFLFLFLIIGGALAAYFFFVLNAPPQADGSRKQAVVPATAARP